MRTAGTRGAADEPRAQPAADRVRGARLRVPVRPDRRPDHLLVQRSRGGTFVWHALHHRLVRQAAGQRRPARARSARPSRSALVAVVVSTILGSLLGLGLARLRFRGHGSTETLLLLPMVTPEIVMGLSLLLFFVALFDSRGSFAQLSIAHITFCISFVAVVVRSRAAGHEPAPRGGRAGPGRLGLGRLPPRDAAADRAGDRGRRRCWRSRSASTTTSSRRSTPGSAARRCRSTSTARSSSGSRPRSTPSRPSWWRSPRWRSSWPGASGRSRARTRSADEAA